MISDHLRSLLYPLGFCASFLFGLRLYGQWLKSEQQKKSHVTKGFWRLSLTANSLLALHGVIQLQFPVALIQTVNAVISWRNLNLTRSSPRSLRGAVVVMALSVLSVFLLFFIQGSFAWMRSPTLPWSGKHAETAPFLWHLFGFSAMVLFASRFWIQWYFAEKRRKSHLGRSFWWISLIGGSAAALYFLRLGDIVNVLGYSAGLVPYFRNLRLMKLQLSPIHSETLFLIAGEQSGDQLGAELISALKRESMSLTLRGVGGEKMCAAGLLPLFPMEKLQTMGFTGVLKAAPRLLRLFNKLKKRILQESPRIVIFIDYPDFNMRLAKALRKAGYKGKLIHYVCPSVWAWRKSRIKDLVRSLDHLLCILPFEKKYFEKTSLPVTYIGHPLVKAVKEHRYDPSWNKEKAQYLSIFPGSRAHEITLNLSLQLQALKSVSSPLPLAISVARPKLELLILSIVEKSGLTATLVPNHLRYELMRDSAASLATSGTVTLELGLHHVPTVVTYLISPGNYYLGRYLFRILLPYYCLVNIICKKELFPEFIHRKLDAKKIAKALQERIDNQSYYQKRCLELHENLQDNDASTAAAQIISQP